MSRISSALDTSYAYLGTLSRLDSNSDGVLSRSERAADEKPGILSVVSQSQGTQEAPKLSNGVLAFMMGARQSGTLNSGNEGQANMANVLYKNTYGQYDLDIAS
ncbi:hypothetical protein [Rhizobium metallidurans]|uniref:Uncharacterized protein n=1 Tax=Rhizobium metallidurans TaxID=1265931 RepID=A0A7W6CSY7_9HYPH|nr:hypothetical protein [Rhizobium metallidurans]MBB3963814.1 hypothetical protein [Rhizobium metallidurans]